MMASKIGGVVRKIVVSAEAPKPVGPYSQAVVAGKDMYISGCLGIDPHTNNLVTGGLEPEAHQALKNMGAVLKAAGVDFGNVVKTTVLLADINDWPAFNNIYQSYFTSRFPARSAFAVKDLPKGAKVEIEAVAVVGQITEED